jgi:hypothetical protein
MSIFGGLIQGFVIATRVLAEDEVIQASRSYSVETWGTWKCSADTVGCGHVLTRPDGGYANRPRS